MEDYFLGKATERIFLPLVQTIIPDIVDYSLPVSGVFHNCAFVKIRKECPYQARRVMHAIWGAGQMSFTKFIIVVDEDVDVHDEQDVLFHWFAHCDPQRDSEIVHGPVDILDHASPELGAGSKIGFDATAKWPAEGKVRRWPRKMEMDQTTIDLITRRWGEYGI
jgi:4-hydroxy-3-polyprenylbenzoate decarboxylase